MAAPGSAAQHLGGLVFLSSIAAGSSSRRGAGGQGRRVEHLNVVTGRIIGAAVRIHSRLGPGLMESVYERILARNLARSGLVVERQKPVSFDFDGMWFEDAYRVDLLVERSVVVEVKAAVQLAPVHERQLLTYLKLLDCRLGLLLNFGAPRLKDGIVRVANGMPG